ncbi:hypothetical protein KSF78_0008428 [Schistosoma japonicum]|nr:hypothetical protein KSF78_0008428 [Schistosoma japonicum]
MNFNDLAKIDELLLKFLEDNYHLLLKTFKESYFSLLTENLKNRLANVSNHSNDEVHKH